MPHLLPMTSVMSHPCGSQPPRSRWSWLLGPQRHRTPGGCTQSHRALHEGRSGPRAGGSRTNPAQECAPQGGAAAGRLIATSGACPRLEALQRFVDDGWPFAPTYAWRPATPALAYQQPDQKAAGYLSGQTANKNCWPEFVLFVPPAGFEPAPPPPEGGALSPELRGLGTRRG